MNENSSLKQLYKSGLERARNNVTNILRVAIILLFLGLAIWAISLNHFGLVIADHEPWLWLTTALISVAPELAGIVAGVVTIDYLNERRQTEQLKAQLIRQMGANSRDVAVPATRELAHHGWLYDGSLSRAPLQEADLSGARLRIANLSGANLFGANLSGADLRIANLSGVNLLVANLSGANLFGANLSEVDLEGANLSGADLGEANLTGANLWGANLSGADLRIADLSGAVFWTIEQLEQAKTLKVAIMPDEVRLGSRGTDYFELVEGPNFEEWKAQYLTNHGGTLSDIRNQRIRPLHPNF